MESELIYIYKTNDSTAQLKQLKTNYEERLQHLELQHDADNSLKQKEDDIVVLMTKSEEYKGLKHKSIVN